MRKTALKLRGTPNSFYIKFVYPCTLQIPSLSQKISKNQEMSCSIGAVLDNIEQGNAEDAVTNIINMLTNPEEVEKIREFGDTMRSVQAEQQKQQNQVQDIIKGLS